MEPRLSVVLPVYREAPRLEELAERLSSWRDTEIILVVEEPTEKTLSALSKLNGSAKIIVSGRRAGKARALSAAAQLARAEAILFLDGDVTAPRSPDTPYRILEQLDGVDILDVRKEAEGDGFVARMRYYEMLGVNIGSWLYARKTGRTPGMVGSAFAAKKSALEKLGWFRRTVWEDADLAARAFLKKMRFRYAEKPSFRVRVSASFKEWLSQEIRAGVGAALLAKQHGPRLLAALIRNPRLLLPSLVVFSPSLVLLAANVLTPADVLYWLATSLTMTVPLVARLNITFPVALGLGQLVQAVKAAIASIASFAASATITGTLARKLGFKFKLHEYAAYFFLYSPVKLFFLAAGALYVLLGGRKVPNWKT